MTPRTKAQEKKDRAAAQMLINAAAVIELRMAGHPDSAAVIQQLNAWADDLTNGTTDVAS